MPVPVSRAGVEDVVPVAGAPEVVEVVEVEVPVGRAGVDDVEEVDVVVVAACRLWTTPTC